MVEKVRARGGRDDNWSKEMRQPNSKSIFGRPKPETQRILDGGSFTLGGKNRENASEKRLWGAKLGVLSMEVKKNLSLKIGEDRHVTTGGEGVADEKLPLTHGGHRVS